MGVFTRFEGQTVEVDGEEVEEVFVDEAGDQLVDLFRRAFGFCPQWSAHVSHMIKTQQPYLVCLVRSLSSG